ncbi:MAG: hypothetical protein F6K39_11030 [Okeania sp. SIO3B3]|nr:hypothetical protein [Okeania sp. SIO3B3]
MSVLSRSYTKSCFESKVYREVRQKAEGRGQKAEGLERNLKNVARENRIWYYIIFASHFHQKSLLRIRH